MTDEGGPFREGDPVLSKLHEIGRTQNAHGLALGELLKETRETSGSRTAVIMPWVGSPLVILALAYAVVLLFHACDHGCAESDREKQREVDAQAAAERSDHERFCAAVGLRFAGTTPVVVIPQHLDSRGYTIEAAPYYGVVCGDGHGDGMYVGVDGHLHALKEPPR